MSAKTFRIVRCSIHTSFAALAWCLFYLRYFQWRDCFNELGRCYDPDGTEQVFTDAAITWAYLGVIFTCFALWHAARLAFTTARVSPDSG